MDTLETCLTELIRIELCGADPTELPFCSRLDFSDSRLFSGLQSIAAKHDLSHVIGAALMKCGLSHDSEWYAFFRAARIASVTRYEQLNYDLQTICRVFSACQKPYILLKGAAIRKYYPYPEMRTSSDIDIFVHEEDLAAFSDALVRNAGYKRIREAAYDVRLVSPTGLSFELHYKLIDEAKYPAIHRVLSDVWEHAQPCGDDAYQLVLDPEYTYFYHIAHMVKHFEYGGCGIRSLMDSWVLLHRASPLDRAVLDPMLANAGLTAFETHIRGLCAYWFRASAPEDAVLPLYTTMTDYILTGGMYGSISNRVKLGRRKAGKLSYLLSRLFVPYNRLKYEYPILQKYPFLLPFFEVHRWFRLCSVRTVRRVAGEVSVNQTLTPEQQAELDEMLSRLGIG